MGVDAGIYANLLRPPRSAQEYMNDHLQTAGLQQNLLSARMGMQEKQRGIEEQNTIRNALLKLGPGATDEQRIEAFKATGLPSAYTQADALQKNAIERKKTELSAQKDAHEIAAKKYGATKDLTQGAVTVYQDALAKTGNPQAAQQAADAAYQHGIKLMRTYGLVDDKELAGVGPYDHTRAIAMLDRDKEMQLRGQAETRAEAVRHNTATERNAAGQLEVSRGNLRVAQGNMGLRSQELELNRNQPKGQYDAERGLLIDPRTGQATPVMAGGQPLGMKDKPLTDAQAKANLFGSRMQESNRIISELEGKYSPAAVNTKMAAEQVPGVGGALGMVGNAILPEQAQQVEQAQRDFVNAVLRRESGAVISPSEFANAQKQYFPQPNDKPETLKQKAKNRQIAIEGLMVEVPEAKRGVPSLTNPSGKAQKAVKRTGTLNGRKVVEYSDGTVEYAD